MESLVGKASALQVHAGCKVVKHLCTDGAVELPRWEISRGTHHREHQRSPEPLQCHQAWAHWASCCVLSSFPTALAYLCTVYFLLFSRIPLQATPH
eukprot:s1553_g12.t1